MYNPDVNGFNCIHLNRVWKAKSLTHLKILYMLNTHTYTYTTFLPASCVLCIQQIPPVPCMIWYRFTLCRNTFCMIYRPVDEKMAGAKPIKCTCSSDCCFYAWMTLSTEASMYMRVFVWLWNRSDSQSDDVMFIFRKHVKTKHHAYHINKHTMQFAI